ncbi:MAG TPA: BadF/BadG/BcrA/BcrD ATPase family protein [Acidobacteriaceae bacterium]|nr:BadF/BadG/BcrA/BcrD ATPase family protein [Acidobacteriaceae bacterium]
MALYLVIDAGGTKTRCLLADDTRILARAETGTVKLMRVAEAEATERFRAMLGELAASAHVALADVRHICFGLAGSRSESVQTWARKAIAESGVGGDLSICGDEEIALDAAFQGGPGILVIAGTGSNAIGRATDGKLFGAGGWGPVLGDEGSGYWIGLEAIRASLRALDQDPRCDKAAGRSMVLLGAIQRHLGVASLGELVALANLRAPSANAGPPDFAALAPVVASCAAAGELIAVSVLRRAGEELASLAAKVHRKLEVADPNSGLAPRIEVAFTGSILDRIPQVHEAFGAGIAAAIPSARVQPNAVDPLAGALYRARLGSSSG